MICSHCQHTNRDGAHFCARCGEPLAGVAPAAAPSAAPSASQTPSAAVAPARALPVQHEPMRGYHPGGLQSSKKYADGKNPFIATLISFLFPAAGQLYNGDFKKAGLLWLVYFVLLILAGAFGSVTIGTGAILPGIVSLGVWGWAITDAYGVAKRQKPLW
jgi:hypothetical protein